MKYCENNNLNWEDYWKDGNNNLIYMVHGKDNIVFHSIIFNALILGLNENYHMVDSIVSSEYLNMNDEKISKSKGNYVRAIDLLEKYNADSLRYYLINNGPEKKDTNFSTEHFETTHNSEILNKYGNLVNRVLKFKELEEISDGVLNSEVDKELDKVYKEVSFAVEKLEFKEATDKVMQFVEYANKFYDDQKPWIQKKEDIKAFNDTIYTCAVIIANLSNLFEPFMPFSSEKIRKYLKLPAPKWEKISVKSGIKLNNIEALFNRI